MIRPVPNNHIISKLKKLNNNNTSFKIVYTYVKFK